jgi:hypothetical protein
MDGQTDSQAHLKIPVSGADLHSSPFHWPVPTCRSPESITFDHFSTPFSSYEFENLTNNLMGCYAAIPTEALLPAFYYIVLSTLLIILKLQPNLQASIFIF